MSKKVFVSGCYDMLHSGHVAFFTEAAQHGDLYVGLGSDKTIAELKSRRTVNTDSERLYMVKALKVVTDAWINSGSGLLDFEDDLRRLKPDIFFVNEDGHTPAKAALCRELGIEYVISKRIPHEGLPTRSTTALRQECRIPYRIDLAGGWLDQPWISKYHHGAVLTICVEPDYDFNNRSGMASSSRHRAVDLWKTDIPKGDKIELAKLLFGCENPPGTKYVSGSQDSIGITVPCLNRLYYEGEYWPSTIETVRDRETLDWIEEHLCLIQLYPRKNDYDVLADTNINEITAAALSRAADDCWNAIINRDLMAFGKSLKASFEAQIAMFPNMAPPEVTEMIDTYKDSVLGYKISGSGGGGYMIFVVDKPLKNSIKIRIRRD